VVKTVAEFVEKREHIVVREKRGFVAYGFSEVTNEVGHRCLQFSVEPVSRAVIVHPGAASFVGSSVKIHIKLRDLFALLIFNAEKLYVWVPDRGRVFNDSNVKERLHKTEKTVKDSGQCEVLLHFLVRE